MNISNLAQILVNRIGKYAYVLAAIGVAFQYWDIVNLENIHSLLPTGLFIYIISSGVAATPFIYFERKSKVAVSKICPYCDKPLEKLLKYKCRKCGGVLDIKKE